MAIDRPPRVENVVCSRVQFKPNDRVIVKVNSPITPEQENRIRRTFQKWSGMSADAILVVSTFGVQVELERDGKTRQL